MLTTARDLESVIASGQALVIAGNEDQLRKLPRGNWIAGTIPYFMTDRGGVTTREQLFVQRVPKLAHKTSIRTYDENQISHVALDSPEHGYSLLVLPAFSAIHESYALNAPSYPQLFMRVIGGFIAGVHLDDLPTHAPLVFSGQTGESSSKHAVAMHIELPREYQASLGIVNIFEQGTGDEITFPSSGFTANECIVDGKRINFHDYLVAKQVDTRLPLVAEYCGTMINVSIQGLDPQARRVQLYAPVFEDVKYRVARPIDDYSGRFAAAIPKQVQNPVFSCNCVLNYLYGQLEGNKTGSIVGPMTFGEVGYQLLNQTMVYVTVGKA
jgi:hypothetical protein